MAETGLRLGIPELVLPIEKRLELLRFLIPAAWCAYTSIDAAWHPLHRERGQSVATAAVVHDYCGGIILRDAVSEQYKNRISEMITDLTDPNAVTSEVAEASEVVSMADLLSPPVHYATYVALRGRVDGDVLAADYRFQRHHATPQVA